MRITRDRAASTQVTTTAHRSTLASSPFVLVLEPTAPDAIWSTIIAAACATLQARCFARVIADAGVRASLELALASATVGTIVVGGEGFGCPFGRSSLALRTRAVAALAGALPIARRRPPRIAALWFELEAHEWLAFVLDPEAGTFTSVPVAAVVPAEALAAAPVGAAS